MKNLDDFINYMFPPVEDKPGYVWINKRNNEIAKVDLIKEKIDDLYEQYRILQEKLNPNNAKEDHIVIDFDLNGAGGAHLHLCKGLQADMVIIDEFLTEEDQDGNNI